MSNLVVDVLQLEDEVGGAVALLVEEGGHVAVGGHDVAQGVRVHFLEVQMQNCRQVFI